MKLFEHQVKALEETKEQNRVAYYHDMGLGKTYTGAEKMHELGAKVNLIICQKSKIEDWINHFNTNYKGKSILVYDLTKPIALDTFIYTINDFSMKWCKLMLIGVINYELAFRRPELLKLKNFTLMLDESSMIQNENAKRSKFILKMDPKNVILLSGTPTGGKYENLYSQMRLLGWNISKKMYYNQYVNYHYEDNEGFPLLIIDGYKNEERLKKKMRLHGCNFLKTEEVFDLPEQLHQTINIPTTKEYRTFRKDSIVTYKEPYNGPDETVEGFINIELVGDTVLTKMLYQRQLCGQYNADKLEAFKDLVQSTNDRLVVFYNFNDELDKLMQIAGECKKPFGVVNGSHKNPEMINADGAILFVQYQAGAMGLNLQKANKIVYFTPPLSSELFEQSKKRIHRIGQDKTCFYYYLTCKGSVEEKIYATLAMRKDYTEALFEEE